MDGSTRFGVIIYAALGLLGLLGVIFADSRESLLVTLAITVLAAGLAVREAIASRQAWDRSAD